MTEGKRGTDIEILDQPKTRTRKPEQYRVLLHNDDYTTMDFVIIILETVFHKGPAEAYRIMMRVHTEGQGIAGVYPYEVAETNVEKVHETARANGFPLRATVEEI
jgi:ATP-dependent Clp protease adaptor protein ClpS